MKLKKAFSSALGLSGTLALAASAHATGLTGSGAFHLVGKCVDLPGWQVTSGTLPQLFDCNGGTNQDWVVRSDGTVRPGFNSNKCLDLQGANTANGTPIQVYDCNGGTNQQWTLGSDGTLRGLGNKCVDDPSGSTNNGTHLQYFDCNGGSNQSFTLAKNGIGALHMLGKCFDLPGANTNDGTQLQIFDCNGGGNQEWVVGFDGTIRSTLDRTKVLDLAGGQTGLGTAIVLDTWTGSPSQQWTLGPDGSIRGLGNRCIDLPNADTTNNTLFQYFDCNGGGNQKFTLDTLPVEIDGQQQSNWCWAATTQMIAAYSGVGLAQCTLANQALSRSDCCSNGGACNQTGWWMLTNNGFTETDQNSALTFAQLTTEFTATRPVAFAWHWNSGGGHAMVATGNWTSTNGQQWVAVNDPEPQGFGTHRDMLYKDWVSGSNYTTWKNSYKITKK
jgi:hypothetical protein